MRAVLRDRCACRSPQMSWGRVCITLIVLAIRALVGRCTIGNAPSC